MNPFKKPWPLKLNYHAIEFLYSEHLFRSCYNQHNKEAYVKDSRLQDFPANYVYDNVKNIYKSTSNTRPQYRFRCLALSWPVQYSISSRASEMQDLSFSHTTVSLPEKLCFFSKLRSIFYSDWLFPQMYSSHNCNQEKPLCVVPTEVQHL